jgi:hypothetical protein
MHDRYLDEPEETFTWEGQCGVCGNWFDDDRPSAVNPYPNGAFCPVCRKNGLMAPGVLHFKPARVSQLGRQTH